MCRVLSISHSGYYDWLKRKKSHRHYLNKALLVLVKEIFQHSHKRYGYPRIHAELKSMGYHFSRNKIARLMRTAGIKACMTQLWSKTIKGRTYEHIDEERLHRNFSASVPNKKWVSDITLIPTVQGWLYVAVIMDLFSRFIVGWSMSNRCKKSLTIDALNMALSKRKAKQLLLHSDQGMQYRTAEYHQLMAEHNITPSMSRKGNCLDNAAMESFFHTMKTECLNHHRFKTFDEAKMMVFEYIEVFYNNRRRHSYLNYMTPSEFELHYRVLNPESELVG